VRQVDNPQVVKLCVSKPSVIGISTLVLEGTMFNCFYLRVTSEMNFVR
jgi:hypothetical protein